MGLKVWFPVKNAKNKELCATNVKAYSGTLTRREIVRANASLGELRRDKEKLSSPISCELRRDKVPE